MLSSFYNENVLMNFIFAVLLKRFNKTKILINGNKMDHSLPDVRNINHKYIAVGRRFQK